MLINSNADSLTAQVATYSLNTFVRQVELPSATIYTKQWNVTDIRYIRHLVKSHTQQEVTWHFSFYCYKLKRIWYRIISTIQAILLILRRRRINAAPNVYYITQECGHQWIGKCRTNENNQHPSLLPVRMNIKCCKEEVHVISHTSTPGNFFYCNVW